MSSVFASDEEAIAECPRGLAIRALKGQAIVWFLPYRRTDGVLEIPETSQPHSCEALIIHDNTGHEMEPGVLVGVSRTAGTYFEFQGHPLCAVPGKALMLVNTRFSPEV